MTDTRSGAALILPLIGFAMGAWYGVTKQIEELNEHKGVKDAGYQILAIVGPIYNTFWYGIPCAIIGATLDTWVDSKIQLFKQ